MKKLSLSPLVIALSWGLSGCMADLSATKVNRVGNANLSATVSVVEHYPFENDEEIPMDAEVLIQFSGPLDQRSIDYFSFRIEDEAGNPLAGQIQLTNGNSRLEFTRMINGSPMAMDPGVTYRVYTEYLKDSEGYLIAPYSFEFRTEEFATNASGGAFHVSKIKPESYLIMPGNPIDVQFSKPIYPNINNYCSNMWNDAFQISGLSFAGGNITIPALSGQVCLRCPPPSNVCNTLRFMPLNGWPQWSPWLLIKIRPTAELRSTSGHSLDGEYDSERGVLFSFGP